MITLQNSQQGEGGVGEGIRMMRRDSGESEMKEQTERKVDEVISQGESWQRRHTAEKPVCVCVWLCACDWSIYAPMQRETVYITFWTVPGKKESVAPSILTAYLFESKSERKNEADR